MEKELNRASVEKVREYFSSSNETLTVTEQVRPKNPATVKLSEIDSGFYRLITCESFMSPIQNFKLRYSTERDYNVT